VLGDRSAAEDATQAVFVKLVRAMDRLQDRETMLPWIFRVATNHCLNLRRNERRRGEDSLVEDLDAVPDTLGDRSDAYLDRQVVQALLSRFDAETQAVAVGAFVEGMERREIARMLGISLRTVTRRLASFGENARKFLTRSDAGGKMSDQPALP